MEEYVYLSSSFYKLFMNLKNNFFSLSSDYRAIPWLDVLPNSTWWWRIWSDGHWGSTRSWESDGKERQTGGFNIWKTETRTSLWYYTVCSFIFWQNGRQPHHIKPVLRSRPDNFPCGRKVLTFDRALTWNTFSYGFKLHLEAPLEAHL